MNNSPYYPPGYLENDPYTDEVWDRACITFKTEEPNYEQLTATIQEMNEQAEINMERALDSMREDGLIA